MILKGYYKLCYTGRTVLWLKGTSYGGSATVAYF